MRVWLCKKPLKEQNMKAKKVVRNGDFEPGFIKNGKIKLLKKGKNL